MFQSNEWTGRDVSMSGARETRPPHPREIASHLQSLPAAHRERLWTQMSSAERAAVLVELDDEARHELIRDTPARELLGVLRELPIEAIADLVAQLPDPLMRELLASMGRSDRESLLRILRYPTDTAGGLMHLDVVVVPLEATVGTVLQMVRENASIPKNIDCLFVVDRHERYSGTLPITHLATANANRSIEELVDRDGPTLDPLQPARDVAQLFEDRDLLTAAVVSSDGELLGRVCADTVVDLIRAENEAALRRMTMLSQHAATFSGVTKSVLRRTPWLLYGFWGAVAAFWVVSHFEVAIMKVAVLAALMPIAASMGGVAAMQTVTLTIRGMARGSLNAQNAGLLLRKELAVAMAIGAIVGPILGGIAFLWIGAWEIGVAATAALMITFLTASAAGVLIPLTLDRFGVDPVYAGSAITTITDFVAYGLLLGAAAFVLL
jgi:magnesium transporter